MGPAQPKCVRRTVPLTRPCREPSPVHLTLSHLPLDLQDNILYNKLNIIVDKGWSS